MDICSIIGQIFGILFFIACILLSIILLIWGVTFDVTGDKNSDTKKSSVKDANTTIDYNRFKPDIFTPDRIREHNIQVQDVAPNSIARNLTDESIKADITIEYIGRHRKCTN